MRPPPRSTLFPYTTLFRSFVLDGVLPPDLTPEESAVGQAEGFERAAHAWAKDCVAQGACPLGEDRKSTRLNSSHVEISYAVFCLKKKKPVACARCAAWPDP